MGKDEKKKERFYRIGITEKDWQFLSSLSQFSQDRIYTAVRYSISRLLDRLKEGKPIGDCYD